MSCYVMLLGVMLCDVMPHVVTGSWHDVTVAQPLYDILNSSSTPTPFFVVADSGFASTDKVRTLCSCCVMVCCFVLCYVIKSGHVMF